MNMTQTQTNIAAALSDVTEQKQILSDKPEPLGQTREDEGRNAQ